MELMRCDCLGGEAVNEIYELRLIDDHSNHLDYVIISYEYLNLESLEGEVRLSFTK
jgi:hypothetical protein